MSTGLSDKLFTNDLVIADVILKGIPFDNACSVGKGAALAPELLRALSGALPRTTETGTLIDNLKIADEGNFEFDLNWERFFGDIEKEAFRLIETGKFCMFLGGDHSVSIPLLEAFCNVNKGKKIGLIHFDAHFDLMDEYEGHKWSHACTERRTLENENINPGDLTFIGIRSYLEEELDFVTKNPEIRTMTASEVYKIGIEKVIEELLNKYKEYDAIYVTIDIDVLDPAYAPGTGTPEGGGLSTREMMEIIKEIVNKLPVKSADIVEVSPPLDSHNSTTSWAALKIMWEIFGALSEKKQE